MMIKFSVTPKFTLEELRDNISQQKFGLRGQSRRFHQLDRDLHWTGKTIPSEVPVVLLSVFPNDLQLTLARSKH